MSPIVLDFQHTLLHARLRLHRGIVGTSVAAAALAAGVMSAALWHEFPPGLLMGWWLALMAVLLLQVVIARRHAGAVGRASAEAAAGASTGASSGAAGDKLAGGAVAEVAPASLGTWLTRYRLAYLLHGVVWGGLAAVLSPLLSHSGVDVLVFVLVAVAAGGMVAGAFDLTAGAFFAVPTLLPLAVWLLGAGEAHGISLAALASLFMAVMTLAARRGERALHDLLRAQASVAERSEAARRSAEQTEVALRSLANQHALMDQLQRDTSQGYWLIDTEGRTTDLNPAMCALLGRPRAQVLGRRALEFFEGTELAVLERELAARRQGRTGAYEIDIVRPDGTRVHALNNATPLVDEQGSPLGSVGLWTDLTAHKRIEQELLASRAATEAGAEYLRRTLDATGDAIFASDADDPQQPVRFANEQMLRMWGLPPGTTATVTPAAIMAAAQALFVDAAAENERLAAIVASSARAEDRLELRDGRVLHRRCEPARVGEGTVRVWSFRDITLEERALAVLQAAEAGQRALLDAFPGFMCSVDGAMRYTYVNQRLADLMGMPREQIIGCSVANLLGPRRANDIEQHVERARSTEVVRVQRTHPAVPGRPRIDLEMMYVAGAVQADGQRIVYAFGTDMTERNQAREALIQARDEAERANRAKSQFLSHMSHELRTPMNAIVGFAQLLEHDTRPRLAAHQHGYVREIQRGARHLLGLINEVLDLGRVEAGQLVVERTAVGLQELADESVALLQPLAMQRAVRLVVDHNAAPELTVWADGTRLKQVLLNLLGNGIKYNRAGGEVSITWQLDGERVLIEVSDTGLGLSDAQRERLFQPFERLDAARNGVEGTGIGLALSRRLVQAMDGNILVRSAPGVGSTFGVSLPAVPRALALAAADGAGDAPTVGAVGPDGVATPARRRVLYIEDNPVNVVLMEAMLAHLQEVQLECAALPIEGLQKALREPPDLVLLDIQMPGMDGFEVLARLRANATTAAVPVLAVSANAMRADRDAAIAAGFSDYLTKPVDLDRLREAVRRRWSVPPGATRTP